MPNKIKDAYKAIKQLEIELEPLLNKTYKINRETLGFLSFILAMENSTFLASINGYRESQHLPPLLPGKLKEKWKANWEDLKERYKSLEVESGSLKKSETFFTKFSKSEKAAKAKIKQFVSEVTAILIEINVFNMSLISSVIGLAENFELQLDKRIREINNFYFKLKNIPFLDNYQLLNKHSHDLNRVKKLKGDKKTSVIYSLEEIKKQLNESLSTYTSQLRDASSIKQIDQILKEYQLKTNKNHKKFMRAIYIVHAVGKASVTLNEAKNSLKNDLAPLQKEPIKDALAEGVKPRKADLTSEELARVRRKFKP